MVKKRMMEHNEYLDGFLESFDGEVDRLSFKKEKLADIARMELVDLLNGDKEELDNKTTTLIKELSEHLAEQILNKEIDKGWN